MTDSCLACVRSCISLSGRGPDKHIGWIDDEDSPEFREKEMQLSRFVLIGLYELRLAWLNSTMFRYSEITRLVDAHLYLIYWCFYLFSD